MQLFAAPSSDTLSEIAYREADHRAKNSIQLAVSILQLQARQAGNETASYHLEEASRRLTAIAAAHELGDEPRQSGIAVDQYLARICSSIGSGGRISFDVSTEAIRLPPKRAIPLGLIASEAITNALRHAFSGHEEGRIRIVLKREPGNQLLLLVQDNGHGLPDGAGGGLGTQLIQGLAKQIQGKIGFGSAAAEGGCTFLLRFPEQENGTSETVVPYRTGRERGDLDIDFLSSVAGQYHPRSFHAGQSIVDENAPVSHILVVVDGIAATYESSLAGKRRIISFHFPGDIANLQCDLGPVTYGIYALTECKVSQIGPAELEGVLAVHPEFCRVLWRAAILETSILKEWVWFSGQHSAAMRVAHLLCEFLERYKSSAQGSDFLLPLTQAQIAEACGLSAIHVNRILRRFRPLGVEIFTRGQIKVTNVTALQRVSHFRREYLYGADQRCRFPTRQSPAAAAL
jgi:two-component sensor histidine kinase/CRP-like cAMP-binding protein